MRCISAGVLASTLAFSSLAHAVQTNRVVGDFPSFEAYGEDGPGRSLEEPRSLVWRAPHPASGVGVAYKRMTADFAQSGQSGWFAGFDPQTGLARLLVGPGVASPGSVDRPEIAEQVARDWLSRYLDLVAPGASVDDFKVASNDLDGDLRTVGFVQTWQGLEARGAQISFRFKNDNLFMIASQAIRRPDGLDVPKAGFDYERARIAALDWTYRDFGIDNAVSAHDPIVLPVGRGANLVIPIDVESNDRTIRVRVFVDAESYRPVARLQLLQYASANLALRVPERAPDYGARTDAPASFATLVVNGVTVETDSAGAANWEGSDPATVMLSLVGQRAQVLNANGAASVLETQLQDGTTYVWDASTEPQVDAQLNAFIHAAKVREYARTFAPTLGFLDYPVKATVNIADICNAFSDGTTINFFQAGGNCENTGRIADVVYHEYGHSLHFHGILAGVGAFDSALSEGQADFLAATITGDPATARGFFYGDQPLRHIDPEGFEATWPNDIHFDPHETGLIIAGALWDLRKALVEAFGETEGVALTNHLYFQALRRAVDIPSMYWEIIAADDDDGDLTNGTPNICIIDRAFAQHGLKPLTVSSSPVGLVSADQNGYEISVELSGLHDACDFGISSATIAYKKAGVSGSAMSVPMTLDGPRLTGTIPKQPEGTALHYRIDISLDGVPYSLPDNFADRFYNLYIGEVKPLYCTDFETDPLADGWVFGAEGGGSNDWEWATPAGSDENGDPVGAYSGEHAIGNDLTKDGNYTRRKTTFAESPSIDLQGNKRIRLQYRRWLNVEDAVFDQAAILVNGKLVWTNAGDDGALHHTDREWRFHDVNLSVFVGSAPTARVRFEMTADEQFQLGGWTIDDFCVVATDPPPCSPESTEPHCASGGGGAGGGGGEGVGGEGGADGNGDSGSGCDCALAPNGANNSFSAHAGASMFVLLGLLARKRAARFKRLRRHQ